MAEPMTDTNELSDETRAWELPGEPTGEALRKLIGASFPFPPVNAGPPDDAMLREALDKAAFRAGRTFERSQQAKRSPRPVMTSAPGDDLARVATAIMRLCNESSECPFCGIDDGEHEPNRLCSELDQALNGARVQPPGDGSEGTK